MRTRSGCPHELESRLHLGRADEVRHPLTARRSISVPTDPDFLHDLFHIQGTQESVTFARGTF